MKRFVSPYKRYIGWAVFKFAFGYIHFLFTLLIPILQILFKMDNKVYEFIPWDAAVGLKRDRDNNFYYYVTNLIIENGPSLTLFYLGLFLRL